jgi:hypothetical protein
LNPHFPVPLWREARLYTVTGITRSRIQRISPKARGPDTVAFTIDPASERFRPATSA